MLQKSITIQNKTITIPAILWGEHTVNLYIAVHGNMSNKADEPIAIFAEEAVKKGYQVLSFDLPEHGERSKDTYPCKPDACVSDLTAVYQYARSISDNISFFGCSMGVYSPLDLCLEGLGDVSGVVNTRSPYSEARCLIFRIIPVRYFPIWNALLTVI